MKTLDEFGIDFDIEPCASPPRRYRLYVRRNVQAEPIIMVMAEFEVCMEHAVGVSSAGRNYLSLIVRRNSMS